MLVEIKWNKVFKNRSSKICERHPLKNFIWSILEHFVPHVPRVILLTKCIELTSCNLMLAWYKKVEAKT